MTTTTVTDYELLIAPDGWDDTLVKYERSLKYWGVFRSFSLPLKFVKDGAELLRNEFYTYNQKATASITIQKLNKVTLQYEDAYVGVVSFASFKDMDYAVEVIVIDGGLAELIKQNESVEYEFNCLKPLLTTPYTDNIRISDNDFGYNYIWILSLWNAYIKIMDKATGGGILNGTYGIKSDFLQTYDDKVALCTGEAWRTKGATDPSAVIFKTTVAEFFKSISALFCVGMGIEIIAGKQTIVLEERSYFFNSSLVFDCGDAKNLNLSIVTEMNFSKIRGGYPEASYGDYTFANKESNTSSAYKTTNTIPTGDLDIESKYRGDFNSIQQYIDLWPADYDDSDEDYTIYFIEIIPSSPLVNYQFQVATGAMTQVFDSVTYNYILYNALISPRHNLDRHIDFISSCSPGLTGDAIVFTAGGNRQAYNSTKATANGETAYKNEYEGPTLTAPVYMRPYKIELECAYPYTSIGSLNTNPNGICTFTYKGNQYEGYILKVDIKLYGRGGIKITLLATDDTDLTNLIR